MNTYDVVLPATGVFDLHGRGRFLRLMTSTGPINAEYYRNQRVIARADGVEAGYAESFETEGFDRVRITGAEGVGFKVVLREAGNVAYDRGATAADVLSMPAVEIAADQSVKVAEVAPVRIGVLNSAAVVAPAGVSALVTPAANVNGLVLKTASVSAGTAWGVLMAKSSTPSIWNDTGAHILAIVQAGAAVALQQIEIPAGMGVYVGASGASYIGAAITYELL